jgi:SPX domain protein involved in polyphosphate accumulation
MIRRFNRYELKYLLQVEDMERIIRDVAELTEADAHGGEAGYRVQSLYYDSAALDCFWAKIEGIKFRRKLRIRHYPAGAVRPTTPVMVEIKQRVNRTVQKRRLSAPLAAASLLCAGQAVEGLVDPRDRQVAAEVRHMVSALDLRPSCVTDYRRRAFIGGRYDAGLRITFDTDLRCRVHALDLAEDAENHLFAPPDWCIMEVKVNEAVPRWVTQLLARHGCQLRRVSKYCAGISCGHGFRLSPLAVYPELMQEHPNG